ncbi:hypothetical protein Tco_0823041 [Tanacetum coccineum]|uniref:Uncharacterized protein n=1 Tax=Tanacetum coccineum TaxID=301880 RepID=A0ABQ5AK33_9ASTR
MLNEYILNSTAYQTYYAYASGAKEPKKARKFKNPASPKLKNVLVSPKEPTKKPAKGKKDVSQTRNPATKPKPTKKKAPVKANRGKGVPDEQQRKISGTDEGTGTKPEVLDVPKYDSENEKESWDDSGEEEDDDDEDNYEDKSDDDGNDDNGDNDDNDDDSNDERTDSNKDVNPNLNQSNEEHKEEEEEEEEYVDEIVHTPKNYELTDDEDNVDNAKEENEEEKDDAEELYRDVNMNLKKEDVEMTDADQGGVDQQYKLLNFENTSPADNEIASLMDTTVRHEEQSSQTSFLFTIPVTVIPEITFNKKVTNLENDLSEMKQVDQYAQAISSIPAIIDRYIGNKQGKAIQQAIKSHNVECKEEALADKREYIDLIDTSQNVTKSLEAAVLAKSSSQPKSAYEAAASLSKCELMKILMDKMKEHKLYLRAYYKRELYDALVKSYNIDKDLFETYGEVFTLKRSRDDKDKDQDPSAGSDRGTKRRKSSKDAESSRDPKSKESKSTSSSKGTSRSQHKSSGKSAHAKKPSHTVDDSGVQQSQEFDTGNNDEQSNDKVAPKSDCNIARAKKPPTSFDELIDIPIDFSTFVMNQINITNLTQELLVGLASNLLKGTCKSRTELEYHFEECFKATSKRLDCHNPEGKQYSFDLCNPLSLIPDRRGRQVIPQDYFINNNLEYLKGGSLSRQYSTSVTKIKAANYEVKWIKDTVPNLWSPVKVERISKKRTKNEAKTTKPDTEWKSMEKTKSRQSPTTNCQAGNPHQTLDKSKAVIVSKEAQVDIKGLDKSLGFTHTTNTPHFCVYKKAQQQEDKDSKKEP